jgi:hypothetical protein
MSPKDDPSRGTLAAGLSGGELAELEERAGLAPGALITAGATPWGDAQREWLRTFVHGATPERLRAEIDRLLGLYNDGDLQRIISGLKKRSAPQRRRRRTGDRKAWNTAEGIQTKQELTTLWDPKSEASWGLSQIDTCVRWQKECRAMPSRRDWYFVQMRADTLKRQVFGR